MFTAAVLVACGTPPAAPLRPPQVPLDAVHVRIDGDLLKVGDAVVGPRDALFDDPVADLHPPLEDALAGARAVWVSAPPSTEWLVVRKLWLTGVAVGAEQHWLSLEGGGEASGNPRPLRGGWAPDCPGGPVAIRGADRAFTFGIHRGPDGVWAEASVRFRPVTGDDGVGIDGLPLECWAPTTCAVLDGVAREACESGDTPPEDEGERLAVAGAIGCLLPIHRREGDLAGWPAELAENLALLGVRAEDDAMLIPEATAPWDATVAVLLGFARAGQPPPALGRPLVEGNDGPPLCTARLRSARDIDAALGRWFARRATAPAPEVGGSR